MSGCKNDEPQQNKVQKFHMSIQASKGKSGDQADGKKNALGLNGNAISATWAEGERVTVYNETKDADLEGYLEALEDGATAQLEGELTGTVDAGDKLTLNLPAVLPRLLISRLSCSLSVPTLVRVRFDYGSTRSAVFALRIHKNYQKKR
ncbi:MAG: hypothetical protein J6W89_05705 [Paludibacteraceae bacterium]|nr:hypothetical protein [Paludibacteraceae bacterium]